MKTLTVICVAIAAVAFSTAIAAKAHGADPEKLAETLKANVKTFRLDLSYCGPAKKPFIHVVLSVPEIISKEARIFDDYVQITEDTALKIIDQLATNGYIDHAQNVDEVKVKAKTFCYRMQVSAGDLNLTEVLDLWDLPVYRRFDELRSLLDGEAAKSMDSLMRRLSGTRALVEKRADTLADNVMNFRISLNYHGDERQPMHRFSLAVEGTSETSDRPDQVVRISEEEAKTIISQLKQDDFFDRAIKSDNVDHARLPLLSCLLRVQGENLDLTESLAVWEMATFQKLDRLAKVLDGEAAASLDSVLGLYTNHRRALERAEEASLALISMVEWPGNDPRGDRQIVHFTLQSNGSFQYDNAIGTLPQEAIKRLREQIEKADVGSPVEDASTITFRWLDEARKRQEKVFTDPEASDRKKLIAIIQQLVAEHKRGAANPRD